MPNAKYEGFEKHRNEEGHIDILTAYVEGENILTDSIKTVGERYLYRVMQISPITSRDAAAVAIATAIMLDGDI